LSRDEFADVAPTGTSRRPQHS